MKTTVTVRIALVTLIVLPRPVVPAVITVGGDCTLAGAIDNANNDSDTTGGQCVAGSGADEIRLTEDVTLTEALPSVTSEIDLQGDEFGVRRDLSATVFRIFHVLDTGDLTLHNTTVSNGVDSPSGKGGGIYNLGTLTLEDSTVSDNTALSGAGIFNLDGTLIITGSTLSGNVTHTGGGIYNDTGTATVTNSTLSGNAALYGGGVFNRAGTVTLTNSTLSGNSATLGGAIYDYGGTANLENTLLANSSGYNCEGTLNDNGSNLADDTSCGPIPSTLTGLDPVLADNGGPTLTHALLAGSNAIDHAGACGLPTDQRGVPREPGSCDSGSFELQCTAPDGATLLLEMDTVDAMELFEVCISITAQNSYTVVGPSGDLTLRAGVGVILGNGFSVTTGGKLTVEIDPGLQMPDAR